MSAPNGVVRLLNTAAGRALCLAGCVDAAAVADHRARYGREPAPVDVVDAGSVTALSAPGLELVGEHLEVAERAGRAVQVRPAALRAAARGRPTGQTPAG